MTDKDIEQVKAEAVEEYRTALLDKVVSVYENLHCVITHDDDGKLTQEEMLAIKSGAESALGYVMGLLGGNGADMMQWAREQTPIIIVKGTMEVGMQLHHENLERLGL